MIKAKVESKYVLKTASDRICGNSVRQPIGVMPSLVKNNLLWCQPALWGCMVRTHNQIEICQQVWKVLKWVEETKRHGGMSSKLLSPLCMGKTALMQTYMRRRPWNLFQCLTKLYLDQSSSYTTVCWKMKGAAGKNRSKLRKIVPWFAYQQEGYMLAKRDRSKKFENWILQFWGIQNTEEWHLQQTKKARLEPQIKIYRGDLSSDSDEDDAEGLRMMQKGCRCRFQGFHSTGLLYFKLTFVL